MFEELDPNFPRGVKVLELVEGGNAEASGKIAPEDLLVAVTAVRFVGAKRAPARTRLVAAAATTRRRRGGDAAAASTQPGPADSRRGPAAECRPDNSDGRVAAPPRGATRTFRVRWARRRQRGASSPRRRFERNLYDATKMGFDNVVEAIGSNEEKWQCQDVILQFRRP